MGGLVHESPENSGGHCAMAAAIGLMIASLPKSDSKENLGKTLMH